MNAAARIGILGGTLDPIHRGHLDTALAARQALSLDHVIILPSRVPPHRHHQPLASRYHRFAMAALAVNGIEGLTASDLELCAPGTSYTADTLSRYRAASGLQASQIFFITGADAFAEIETWHRYPEVLTLAQFVVVSRPGFPVASLAARLPGLAPRMLPVGGVTDDLAIHLLDAKTSDVSSTEIRRRLQAGEPLAGLVPAAVDTHIRQHGLYRHSGADHLHGQD
jgi:nicotinate-nucleotide adenylyltransferase